MSLAPSDSSATSSSGEGEGSAPPSRPPAFSELRRLWAQIGPFRSRIILGTVYSILNKVFDLAPPVLIGIAVDIVVRPEASFLSQYGLPQAEQQLWLLALLTLLVWGAESVFEYLYAVTWRTLAQELQHDVRVRAYDHVQSLDHASLDELTSGRLMAVLNDDVNQLERFFDSGANSILQLATTILVVGGIFIGTIPTLAWMAFLPAPLVWMASIKVQAALAPRYRAVRDQAGQLNDLLANNIGGLTTIKSFVTEQHESQRLRQQSLEYQHRNEKAITLSSAFVPIIRMAIVVGFVLIMVYAGLSTIRGGLEIGTYSVLVFMTQRLLWPMTTLGTTLDLYRRSMASIARILELLERPGQLSDGSRELDTVRGELSFEQVSFHYPRSPRPVLDGFSLQVSPGTTVGLVGTTGSGKTTLVKLLLRFYDPQQGRVLLDGHPLPELKLASLRHHIGLVSQDVFLFDGTVEENLRYGSFGASEEALRKAIEQAAVDEFLDRLPHGLQTLVGERGVRLSGGQRQRIALARALLKNPPILVLDEATSSVDNETERAITLALEEVRRERTVLIVAHRLSTIRHADRIVVMSEGQLVEEGRHEELLQRDGVYASLWQIQSGELPR
jgi:ATP-binding cassette subfamily B protein